MSITRTAARGVAWNMLFGVGSRVLQLVGTLVLTRFIAPDAYGAVLAASIAILTAGTFTSFAFGQYLIANKSAADVSFQAMVLHVALGIAAMAVVVALRHPVSGWLGTPSMAVFIPGFALAHVIERLRYVPERLLMRDLRFRAIATINGSCDVLFTVAALALVSRHGASAILYATVIRAAVATGLFLFISPSAAVVEDLTAALAHGACALRVRAANHDHRTCRSRGHPLGQPADVEAVRPGRHGAIQPFLQPR